MNALEYLANHLGVTNDDITQNGKYYRIRKSILGYKLDVSGTTVKELMEKTIIEIEKYEKYAPYKYMVMVGTMNHYDEIYGENKLRVVLANVDIRTAVGYAEANSWAFHESLDIFYVIVPNSVEAFKKMLNPMLFAYDGSSFKHNPVLNKDDYNIIDVYQDTDFVEETKELSVKKGYVRKIEEGIFKAIDYEAFSTPEEMKKLISDYLMIELDDSKSFERYIPNTVHHIPDED